MADFAEKPSKKAKKRKGERSDKKSSKNDPGPSKSNISAKIAIEPTKIANKGKHKKISVQEPKVPAKNVFAFDQSLFNRTPRRPKASADTHK